MCAAAWKQQSPGYCFSKVCCSFLPSLSFFFVVLSILLTFVWLSTQHMLFSSTSFLCALAILPARIGRRLLYCVLAAVNKIKHLEILKCFLILTVIYPHILLSLLCNCLSPSTLFKRKSAFLDFYLWYVLYLRQLECSEAQNSIRSPALVSFISFKNKNGIY